MLSIIRDIKLLVGNSLIGVLKLSKNGINGICIGFDSPGFLVT